MPTKYTQYPYEERALPYTILHKVPTSYLEMGIAAIDYLRLALASLKSD